MVLKVLVFHWCRCCSRSFMALVLRAWRSLFGMCRVTVQWSMVMVAGRRGSIGTRGVVGAVKSDSVAR